MKPQLIDIYGRVQSWFLPAAPGYTRQLQQLLFFSAEIYCVITQQLRSSGAAVVLRSVHPPAASPSKIRYAVLVAVVVGRSGAQVR